MALKNGESKVRCSFCGRTEEEVIKLIAGPDGAFICDECVAICTDIIAEEMAYSGKRNNGQTYDINLIKPREMKEFLDEYVVGQDEAKKVLYDLVDKIFQEATQKAILERTKREASKKFYASKKES